MLGAARADQLNVLLFRRRGRVNGLHHFFVARAVACGRKPWNAVGVIAPPAHFGEQTPRAGFVIARAEIEQHFDRIGEESQVGVFFSDPQERVIRVVRFLDGFHKFGPRKIGALFVAEAVCFEQFHLAAMQERAHVFRTDAFEFVPLEILAIPAIPAAHKSKREREPPTLLMRTIVPFVHVALNRDAIVIDRPLVAK